MSEERQGLYAASDDPRWEWFRSKLAAGDWTRDDLAPLHEQLASQLLWVLEQIRLEAGPSLRTGLTLHRALPGNDSTSYFFRTAPGAPLLCATVVPEGPGRNQLRQIEAITLDLSDVPPLPCDVRVLPGLPDATVAWMREELAMTERIRLYNYLARAQSRESALAWFHDGAGYALAARAHVPYMEPGSAFLWYAAWSETHLHCNAVVIRRADSAGGCLVMVDPLHRRLYRKTTHLRQQVSPEDYEALFESVWKDRARSAGFDLTILDGSQLELVFSRSQPDSPC